LYIRGYPFDMAHVLFATRTPFSFPLLDQCRCSALPRRPSRRRKEYCRVQPFFRSSRSDWVESITPSAQWRHATRKVRIKKLNSLLQSAVCPSLAFVPRWLFQPIAISRLETSRALLLFFRPHFFSLLLMALLSELFLPRVPKHDDCFKRSFPTPLRFLDFSSSFRFLRHPRSF